MKQLEKLQLYPNFFNFIERDILNSTHFTLSTFQYSSGVEALRIKIGRGEFVWLPFLGQLIWDWKVDGVSQKFSGFMTEPSYGKNFLENYGAFMIHCGFTGMGNPKPEDQHLHHGELPVSHFDQAWIEFSDNKDFPIALCGQFNWKVPYKGAYRFSPKVYLAQDGLSTKVEVTAENCAQTPLEYMYLAHINFDFEGAKTIDYLSYPVKADSVRIIGGGKYSKEPEKLLSLNENCIFDPEEVAVLAHQERGKFVSKLFRENGTTHWVSQNRDTLDHTVMWMTHNPDRGACGFALPSTAGPEGKGIETTYNNIKTLKPHEKVIFEYGFGYSD